VKNATRKVTGTERPVALFTLCIRISSRVTEVPIKEVAKFGSDFRHWIFSRAFGRGGRPGICFGDCSRSVYNVQYHRTRCTPDCCNRQRNDRSDVSQMCPNQGVWIGLRYFEGVRE
jgi:hypothetical protein